ncbi:ACR COG1678 domain containing protein [Nitzschia inconspicua]|uniref:ACR COG1678 domain containing protein n=1 Tax=Nitzschia inconspicua TaxID=303405 RepID=A0A9K3PCQ5_9STRA|nr:ACR COG1678 domain containing protein [Nitzschia inconspicua]
MSSNVRTSSLIVKRLYRNLLRTARPFVSSPDATVLTSLLHRTGIEDWNHDHDDEEDTGELAEAMLKQDYARDLTSSYADRVLSKDNGGIRSSGSATMSSLRTSTDSSSKQHRQLFRRLLREVMTGPAGYAKMVFPSKVDPNKLQRIIQREFRNHQDDCVSKDFDFTVRKQTAFTALQELNKKLAFFHKLQQAAPEPSLRQAALRVSPLPTDPPSSYLRPGTFLVAHPYLNDTVFSKTVICILDHQSLRMDDKEGSDKDSAVPIPSPDRQYKIPGQTYGLVINRVSLNERTGRTRSLKEAFQENMLPERLSQTFGNATVRHGGPVHMSIQMIHSLSAAQQDQQQTSSFIGGTMIPEITAVEDQSPAALYSDQATFYRGNIFKAISAVENGDLDREDVSFYVGASTWSPGQLAAEIAQGYWIPCRGPPEMALHGICEHQQPQKGQGGKRPLTDLWLSMLSACGEDEAKLAHLFYNERQWDENGQPCDAFEDDGIDEIIIF